MAKKKSKSPAEKEAQKKRTYLNQLKRYESLIKNNPTSRDLGKWEEAVKFYKSKLYV